MNHIAPSRIASLAALVVLVSAGDCSFDDAPRYSLGVAMMDEATVFTSFEVGDEPVFVATEKDIDASQQPPSSQSAPNDYGWGSSDTLVATVSQAGVVRARRIGGTTITVQSLHAKTSFPLFVGPKFGRIELTPDTAKLGIGETATFQILAYDPAGKPISADSSRGYLRLDVLSPGVGALSPFAFDQWMCAAKTIGTTRLVARVDVYNGARLRDTSVLIVR